MLQFAKNVASLVRQHDNRGVDLSLQTALAVHEALAVHGINYVPDPTTPYIEYVQNEEAIDFLQFPRQTLTFLSGDCDDLSILYAAMLQAVSVETALVTVPRHIYVAIKLSMDADTAARTFARPDDLIVRDDTVWLPVEVTRTQQPFSHAREVGARLWRQHEPRDEANFAELAEAWQEFAPVGLPGDDTVPLPELEPLRAAYVDELVAVVDSEIEERAGELLARIEGGARDPRVFNRVGTLYARFGRFGEARGHFESAVALGEYTPALFNLGNIHLVDGDLLQALELYQRAHERSPQNSSVLLGLVQVHERLRNQREADRFYQELVAVAPAVAERHGSVDVDSSGTVRASEGQEVLLWED